MALVVFIIVALLILVSLWIYGGLRETVGELLIKVFPKAPLKKGDKVDVFLNGAYNRTATVTGASAGKLYIYDGKLGLPIDYRGRFYAIAVDAADGSKLVYLGNRKNYRFVRAAELVRKSFSVIDDENMLPVTDEVAMAEESDTPGETDETEETDL